MSDDKNVCINVLNVHKRIIFHLAGVVSTNVKHVVYDTLENVATNSTPAVHPRRWLAVLNEHFAAKYAISLKTIVECENAQFLETINKLFITYSSTELLNHIGWWMVQQYATVMLQEASMIQSGDGRVAQSYGYTACETMVEDVFRTLLVAEHVAVSFTRSDRKKVDGIFCMIHKQTMQKLSNSTWIDDNSKIMSAQKLTNLKRVLWPPLMTDGELQDMYAVFPGTTFSYWRDWKASVQVLHTLLGTKLHEHLTSLPHNIREFPINYHYFFNTITVAMNVIAAPLYYRKATPAINYGGLGATYAMHMVRVFDPQGIRLHGAGKPALWWQNTSLSMYRKKVACDSSAGIFQEVPALETTHAAYVTARRGAPGRLLISMEGFTDEQIFFISYCHSFCGTAATKGSMDECNKGVRNFEPFSNAFDCKAGSPMNPKEKCTFF
ncbi:endothelin-converting enzyme 2-like [Ornithodoros turicata]|uniref:endothelin-converting enzyme 2-like n=1 Tax=Ornithodoros turicata TaxID=34597 RepID=UPI0031398A45